MQKAQRFILLFFITISISGSHAVSSTAQLTIVVNPGQFLDVQEAARGEKNVDWWDGVSDDDNACTECFAAAELAHFLIKCTTIPKSGIRFLPSERLPAIGDVIVLGSSKSNKLIRQYSLPDSIKLESGESFCIRAFQENGRTVTIIEGSSRTGTLYGTYRYLEELGIRFYGLGDRGTVYPDTPVRLPESLTIIGNPSFLTRGFHAWEDRGNEEFFLWMARNRMNYWTSMEQEVHLLKKLGIVLADGGHTVQMDFLNPDTDYPYNYPKFRGDENKPNDPYDPGSEYTGDINGDGTLTYFEAHPEWYGLYDGKRSDNVRDEFGDNYCTSNSDATTELAKNMIQCLIDGKWRYVDIVKFWMMDATYKWCGCDNCNRQGTKTDRLLAVVDQVSREIKKARSEGRLKRPVRLTSLAYHETIEPPSKPLPENFDYDNIALTFFPIQRCYNHTFADPSCTEYNSSLCRNYLKWTSGSGRLYNGTMLIGEYYNISYLKSMPLLYTRTMAADIPWYHSTGTRHFHYMHTPTRLWGTWTLNQYLLAQLLWDVDTDSDDLLDEYFRRYYPTTSDRTRGFYRKLEKGMESFKVIRYWGWKNSLKDRTKNIFPKKHFQFERYSPLTNDGIDLTEMREYILAARGDIDRVLLDCTDDLEKARLLEDERRFRYGEAMVFFHYHLYRTAMFFHDGNGEAARIEFDELKRYAEKLRGITDEVQVSSSHANAKNGFEATQAVDLYEFFEAKYGK